MLLLACVLRQPCPSCLSTAQAPIKVPGLPFVLNTWRDAHWWPSLPTCETNGSWESFPRFCCVFSFFIVMLSCVRLFATRRTVARQPPLSVEFSRQEYGSGWVAVPCSRGSWKHRTRISGVSYIWQADSLPMYHLQRSDVTWKSLSGVWLFATPWTVACQAPLSMEFCRQEYWSG